MFLSRRKKSYCQNCQYPLTSNYNFCPECGQENTDKIVSFNTLIRDFFINYFSYDSRLIRTIKPFLFKPGFLTKEFINGKRTKYMHPLRLYLIISFFYFLAFSQMITHEVEDGKMLDFNNSVRNESNDSINLTADRPLPPPKMPLPNTAAVSNVDSLDIESIENSKNNDARDKDYDDNDLKILTKEGVTPEEVLDNFNFKNTTTNIILARQAIKLSNERKEVVFSYLVKNASIMMFLLLPFFALLLKLFYIRRKRFYVEHITFTLHIHSFMFFILLIVIIINYFWPNGDILAITIIIIFIYFLLSLKKFYQQSWIKTFFKLLFLSWGYGISFLIFLIATVAISFYLY